jgi:hypothetical protein
MSGKLTTAQRQQVINDYINGILTLEYKVKEYEGGKYRVSRRSEAEIRKMKEEYDVEGLEESEANSHEQPENDEEPDTDTAENVEDSEKEKSESEPKQKITTKPLVKPAPKPSAPKPRSAPRNEMFESLQQTNQEILNHLRLLGEEKARKRQKKEVKREVKHRINKIYKEPAEQDE